MINVSTAPSSPRSLPTVAGSTSVRNVSTAQCSEDYNAVAAGSESEIDVEQRSSCSMTSHKDDVVESTPEAITSASSVDRCNNKSQHTTREESGSSFLQDLPFVSNYMGVEATHMTSLGLDSRANAVVDTRQALAALPRKPCAVATCVGDQSSSANSQNVNPNAAGICATPALPPPSPKFRSAKKAVVASLASRSTGSGNGSATSAFSAGQKLGKGGVGRSYEDVAIFASPTACDVDESENSCNKSLRGEGTGGGAQQHLQRTRPQAMMTLPGKQRTVSGVGTNGNTASLGGHNADAGGEQTREVGIVASSGRDTPQRERSANVWQIPLAVSQTSNVGSENVIPVFTENIHSDLSARTPLAAFASSPYILASRMPRKGTASPGTSVSTAGANQSLGTSMAVAGGGMLGKLDATATPSNTPQRQMPTASDANNPNKSNGNHSVTVHSVRLYPQRHQKSHNQQMIVMSADVDQEEQNLFESRLKEDPLGVAVRKINQNGKSQLRYVKCVPLDPTVSTPLQMHHKRLSGGTSIQSNMSRSVGLSRDKKRFHMRNRGDGSQASKDSEGVDDSHKLLVGALSRRRLALSWGYKSRVTVGLERFTCVRKGKTTDRTKRNNSPACQLLSVLTDDPTVTLDVEAPTRMDRDKFARAFARFLGVPLETDHENSSSGETKLVKTSATVSDFITANTFKKNKGKQKRISSAHTAPELLHSIAVLSASSSTSNMKNTLPHEVSTEKDGEHKSGSESNDVQSPRIVQSRSVKNLPVAEAKSTVYVSGAKSEGDIEIGTKNVQIFQQENRCSAEAHDERQALSHLPDTAECSHSPCPVKNAAPFDTPDHTKSDSTIPVEQKSEKEDGDQSTVSSLTAGFEHEIVEELHQVIHELRTELEASRAEAARAVKVAEQAIQSAESCSSNDWNSTVTHKAAEAAAQAQKKSAEAMARQRLAEEKLAGERRAAAYWRQKAETNEEDAGALQTRASTAEVMRMRKQHELEVEKRRAEECIDELKEECWTISRKHRDRLKAASDKNRDLEVQLEKIKLELALKCEESRSLLDQLAESKIIHESSSSQVANGVKVMKKFVSRGRRKRRAGDSSDERSLSKEPGESLLADVSANESRLAVTSDLLTTETVSKLYIDICATSEFEYPISSTAVVFVVFFTIVLQRAPTPYTIGHEFEVLRKTVKEEGGVFASDAEEWSLKVAKALMMARRETLYMQERLAFETSLRRNLQHQVQDYRGTVRVYVRPRPIRMTTTGNKNGVVSTPSLQTLCLCSDSSVAHPNANQFDTMRQKREFLGVKLPVSYEFDRVFSPEASQRDVYEEVEELIMSVLDGYVASFMAYGQANSGRTYTLLGDVSSEGSITESGGVLLHALRQLFAVSQKRCDRFLDNFSMTILEVKDERLCDLVASTSVGQERGRTLGADVPGSGRKRNKASRQSSEELSHLYTSNPPKLEIRSNYDGDTVVQGLTSVPVASISDVLQLWSECLALRNGKLSGQSDVADASTDAHFIFSVSVSSRSIANGTTTVGKLQFVDLASCNVLPSLLANKNGRISSPNDASEITNWLFVNKSLCTLSEVVDAKCQFVRNVPYRNSTLTHLLRDAFEGDAKVLMFLCLSSDAEDVEETVRAIKFAQSMRRVSTGVATRHVVSLTER